jgi:hypothetical protein
LILIDKNNVFQWQYQIQFFKHRLEKLLKLLKFFQSVF